MKIINYFIILNKMNNISDNDKDGIITRYRIIKNSTEQNNIDDFVHIQNDNSKQEKINKIIQILNSKSESEIDYILNILKK